jgi:hypothetical protein
MKHTIPEPKDQRANRRRRGSTGGRPAGFDRERYWRRNEVERTINRLKKSRAVATRYDRQENLRVPFRRLRESQLVRPVIAMRYSPISMCHHHGDGVLAGETVGHEVDYG